MKVLLATDGSACSEQAAAMLARLPHHEKLDLKIVTVVGPPSVGFFSPAKEFMEQLSREDRKLAELRQQKTAEVFAGANAAIETVVLDGYPAEMIVSYAASQEIELIVLGAKGHSQIDRIVLGSTSDYVATHAPCSVMVVRTQETTSDEPSLLRIAIAYDASTASRHAVEEVLQFDWGSHTELSVVGVAGYSPVFDPEYGFNPKSIREEAQAALREASQRLQTRVRRVDSQLIEYDHVAEGLVRFTEDAHMDLIVIGDTGRSTLARALLGSVSRYVLRHARCGVWITRNQGRTQPISEHGVEPSNKLAGAT